MSDREVINDHLWLVDKTPLPPHIPQVPELGATTAPLLSASYYIGARAASLTMTTTCCAKRRPRAPVRLTVWRRAVAWPAALLACLKTSTSTAWISSDFIGSASSNKTINSAAADPPRNYWASVFLITWSWRSTSLILPRVRSPFTLRRTPSSGQMPRTLHLSTLWRRPRTRALSKQWRRRRLWWWWRRIRRGRQKEWRHLGIYIYINYNLANKCRLLIRNVWCGR